MIGERLLDLRQDAGLSQEDLGNFIGVSNRVISGYERNENEPPDEIKIKIAKFFRVSVDYLVGLTDKPLEYKNHQIIISFEDKLPEEAMEEFKVLLGYIKYKYNKNIK